MASGKREEFGGTERFAIQRKLGAGGMGVVYLAHDKMRNTEVALKTLKKMSAQDLYRFKNEFRALAGLRHPNLIRLYELINEGGQWFFTMEYLDGIDFLRYVRGENKTNPLSAMDTRALSTLPSPYSPTWGQSKGGAETLASGERTLVDATSPGAEAPGPPDTGGGEGFAEGTSSGFDEARLRDAFRQLAEGVFALHAMGKVHRDIKPSNVMVAQAGSGPWAIGDERSAEEQAGARVVLMDFGLVAEFEEVENARSTGDLMVGTPFYMAPEQANGAPVGPEADWYSVGVMLYECLTGRLPFLGSVVQVLMQKIQQEPTAPRELFPEIPEDLNDLCVRLLRIDPKARPSGEEVLACLGAPRRSHSKDFSRAMPGANLFVGRQAELGTLRRALSESRAGAVALVVEGESGLGKTALVRHFLDSLRDEPRTLVLAGRCYEQESVPYKAFDGIIDALSRHLLLLDGKEVESLLPREVSLVGRLFPVLNRVPKVASASKVGAEVESPQELRSRAFIALRELFSKLGEKQPLILFIDDLQWADHDSLVLLKEVIRPPGAPSLFLLATRRTTTQEQEGPLESMGLRRLVLEALPPEEAESLARQLLASSGAVSVVETEALAREAGGHPLFISELALYRATTGVGDAKLRLDEALFARVSRLPPPARRLVEFVAVAGAPVAQKIIAEAAGLSFGVFLSILADLRQEQLVRTLGTGELDTVEPYHDRVRESVAARLSEEARRECSSRLVEALLRAGADKSAPQVLVRHLEAVGETDRAAELAIRTAERARDALAFDRAATFYRTALRLGSYTPEEKRKLFLELGEVLANAGRGPEAADAFLAAAEGQDDDTRLDCQYRAAEQLLGSGHIARGLDLLKVVLADLGEELPPTPEVALEWLLQHRKTLKERGLAFSPRPASRISARELITLDIFKAISLCLAFVDNVRGAYFQTRGLLFALETGEVRRLVRALVIEAVYQAQEGEEGRQAAEMLQAEAKRLAAQRIDTYLIAYITIGDAFLAYYKGRFREAAARFKDAEECFRNQIGTAWELNIARLHRLRATDYQGAWNQLRPLYNEYVRDAHRRDDRYAEASLTRWFNVLWLAQDSPDKAGEDLDRKLWTPPSGGYHLQHFLELRARVELALYRGQGAGQSSWALPALHDAERSLLFRIQIAQVIADWLRGRMALANAESLGGGEAARAEIEEAERMADRMEKEGICYAVIWGKLVRAGAAAQRGDKRSALSHLQDTIRVAEENDFPLCAAVARRRQGELLGGDQGRALIAEADRWMQEHEIKNPIRMSEIFAPGFGFTRR